MNIRLARRDDMKGLASIYPRAYNPLNIGGESWDEPASLKVFEWYFVHNPELFFVAESDGKLVGAIMSIVKPWFDGVHLVDFEVFVNPDSQKLGAGSALLQALLSAGKEKHSVVACDGITHVEREHPLKWYKSLGFDVIDDFVVITGQVDKILEHLQKESLKAISESL